MTWRERIAAARQRGKFTTADVHLACGCGWRTCAVGEQAAPYPELWRTLAPFSAFETESISVLIPIDPVLIWLGGNSRGFGKAVRTDDIDEAERLLDAIEDRVLELKREAQA